ncbi:DoxX family protein [Pseudorhodoplanes sp.]|uniref:DoxX family protein n=1 Tax=Pseudorhodoplanes sp. TaxID=1934341 RepID=UPI003D0C5FAD
MTDTPISMRSEPGLAGLILRANALIAAIPYWLIALVTRISIAAVFWRSGQTKVEGWRITDATLFLFKDEYKLPLIDPTLAAYLATFAEHFFPVLLVMGFATRFAALALLIMTLVIEIFVYPDAWPTHGVWAACFLILMAQGPGKLSLDHLIAQRYR